MKRDIYPRLVEWKSSKRRKPLLLRGARQTGKTYALRDFGQRQYRRIHYFNFESDPALDEVFSRNLDPHRIVDELSIYSKDRILPEKDLVVFDEVQASGRALSSLKYFDEDASEFHLACAGSLLGVKLARPTSFPVGKVNFLALHPMSFLEFLEGIGEGRYRSLLESLASAHPIATTFHLELVDLLKRYYVTGGMPEVVQHFAATGDLLGVRSIQREILDSYVLDFAKHAPTHDIPKLSEVWESVPVQLARENKKFVFTAVRKSARAREYANALTWLEDAGLIARAFRTTTARQPLKGYASRNAFKVYGLDVGLLGAMAGLSIDVLTKGDRLFTEYRGAFVESYAAQQLTAGGHDLYYWCSSGGKAELDFLFDCPATGAILPLEVKAGVNPKSKSLRSFDDQFSPPLLLRATLLNLKRDGKICNVPLYAMNCLGNILQGMADVPRPS